MVVAGQSHVLQRFEADAVDVLIHRNFVILAMLIDDMLTPQ